GVPFPFIEVVGCRAEHVRYIAPDISATVAGKIYGIVNKIRRHELRLAHRAGPGTNHLVAGNMTILHDAHSDDQFVPEIGMAILHVSERGERAKYIPTIFFGTEIGFHAPQGEQDPALDLEFLFDGIKGLGPFTSLELSFRDATV